MQSVGETSTFTKKATELVGEEGREEIVSFLANNPEGGAEIKGTGGIRKLRFKADGKGKSGGVRVIYYFYNETFPIYALTVYGKKEKADLSASEKKVLTALAAKLKAAAKKEKEA